MWSPKILDAGLPLQDACRDLRNVGVAALKASKSFQQVDAESAQQVIEE